MASSHRPHSGKNKHHPVKPVARPGKSNTSKAGKSLPAGRSLIQFLDDAAGPYLHVVFFISMLLTLLIGGLLFDVKISTGGDDSSYIEMANNFMKGRSFPSWHGPLYPIFLSLPMLIFGVKVIWLKLFSFVFILGHLALLYYTFRKEVSPALLTLVMLIISVSSPLLYFASQTYSEAMFMFLQSLVVFIFIKNYLHIPVLNKFSLKEHSMDWIFLGFFVFLASLTRNIGIVTLLAMIFFLLIEKRFRESLMLLLSFLVFLIPFRIYKSVFWPTVATKGSGQFSEILLKNPYNEALGREDFSGMITRFIENARLYLSKHFMISLGLQDPSSTEKSWLVTLLIIALFLLALFYSWKRTRILFFVAIYLGTAMSATFIALQQSWDQIRMVIIYFPMLLLLLGWGMIQLSVRKGYGFLQLIVPLLLVFIFFKSLGYSIDKMKVNQKILSRNVSGNRYYGFTPDWQNYLRMSEWVGKNIPDSIMVAARKPSMSFIYSNGRDFYGIYRFPTVVPEELLNGMIPRTGELQVIPQKAIAPGWPVDLQLALKQSNRAFVAEGSDVFGVYDLKGSTGIAISQALESYGVKPLSTDSMLKRVRSSQQSCFAVSADSLIRTLRKNAVEYVIVASLRANPNAYTGNIINNIQRYLYFVELKYPGILTLVHQIGSSDQEEPAWLYKINYGNFGL